MKYLIQLTLLLLMISIGMSISLRQLVENWRRITFPFWARLVFVTFLVPPFLALALGWLLSLDKVTTVGLFLVAVAPGAPLMTRNATNKGFDMHVAASYQVWGAVLAPLMIPLLVAGGAWLYGREIWVSPVKLLQIIAWQQFLPLLAGMALMRVAPAFSNRVKPGLTVVGNALLVVALVAILVKLGPALQLVNWTAALAAILLALGCVFSVRLVFAQRSIIVQTLSICNANRHVGIALLLSGQEIHDLRPVPVIAAYALAATLVMVLYAKFASREGGKMPA